MRVAIGIFFSFFQKNPQKIKSNSHVKWLIANKLILRKFDISFGHHTANIRFLTVTYAVCIMRMGELCKMSTGLHSLKRHVQLETLELSQR